MAKRRYNKFGNSNDFYVEQNGICSNNRSKKYNTTVNCYDRNPGCHKIASDVEAIIQRMKMDFESKKSIDQQERNARIINADSYRVRQELEKKEKKEKGLREKNWKNKLLKKKQERLQKF